MTHLDSELNRIRLLLDAVVFEVLLDPTASEALKAKVEQIIETNAK